MQSDASRAIKPGTYIHNGRKKPRGGHGGKGSGGMV